MASLAQQALDLVVTIQIRAAQNNLDYKQTVEDMCSAIQLLAQNALSATPSVDNPDPSAVAVDVPTTSPVNDAPAGT